MLEIWETLRFGLWCLRLNAVSAMAPDQVLRVQQIRLRDILRHAVAQSPFYRRKYRGLDIERCDLQDLPITNKDELMGEFDDVVTDRRIRRADLEHFLGDIDNVPRRYLGDYPVIHTSGSQGQPALIVLDPFVLKLLFAIQMTRGNVTDHVGPMEAVKRFVEPARLAVISMKDGFYPQGVVWRHVPRPVRRFLKILQLSPADPDLIEQIRVSCRRRRSSAKIVPAVLAAQPQPFLDSAASSPPSAVRAESRQWRTTMLDPRTLTHAQLAAIVADVQAILWTESRLLPDFPREYGEYWNPAKEWDADTVEEIADVLSDFKPADFMPVDLAERDTPAVIDANELLWAARVLASLVRVHRNVIPAVRENVKLAEAILASYADVPDFDPREQPWTIERRQAPDK